MNTQPSPHTQFQEPLGNTYSGVRKASAIVSMAAMINITVPAPLSTSTHTLMDDTAGKAMTFVPPASKVEVNTPAPKTEVNASKTHNILAKYTIQPGDTISALACVFGVKKADLLKHNPQITDEDYIRAEDTLIIPNPIRNIMKCVGNNGVEIKEKIKIVKETAKTVQAAINTKEIQSPEMSHEVRKAFLANNENAFLLEQYIKNYFRKNYDAIKASPLHRKERLETYFTLYEHDQNILRKRIYMQEIKESLLDTKTEKDTEKLLEKAGYTATAKDYLWVKSHIESSGGLYMESIKKAQGLIKLGNEAKLKGTRGLYNKKITEAVDTALSQIVGDKNDIGPHGITPNWVRNEIKKGWNPGCELRLIDDFDTLKREVRVVLAGAVKNNLSQEQIAHQLTRIDSRFDSKVMGEAVLFSFNRICTRFMKKGVSAKQAVKQAHITYNGHGPRAEKYAQKMHMTLGLMSALNKAQSGSVAKNTASIKHKNKDIVPAKHGIDPSKVGGGEIEKDPITGTPLCSRTARNGLLESGANPGKVDQDDAIKLMDRWLKTKKGKSFNDQDTLKAYLISRAKKGKVLGDMTMNTPNGHRAYSFFGIDEKLYISDIYRGDKEAPMLFDDYMEKNLGKSFTKVVVNTHVGKIYNPSAKFVVNIQKEPTPMSIIMASAPAGTVPVMIQSDGVYKLSQGISTSVVKLTDTTTRDNHLYTDTNMGDDKILFPAVTSANTRKTTDRHKTRTDIIIGTINDPEKKIIVAEKLGEDPEWTLVKNIELQKKRWMDEGNKQALKNARRLKETLVMSDEKLAKMSALNMMAT